MVRRIQSQPGRRRLGWRRASIHFNDLTYGQGAATALPIAGHFLHQLQQEHPGTKYLTRIEYQSIDTTAYNCSDYREKAPGVLEKLFDAFEKQKKKDQEKKEKNFFERLFNKLKKNKK